MVNIYVLALLCAQNSVLLLHRDQVSYGKNLYGLVGGKVEQGETALQAIQREVKEEVGLDLPLSDFKLVHVLHRKGTETEFIALCFYADITPLSPVNNEPAKHDHFKFFDKNQLPADMIDAHKQSIEQVSNGSLYSEHGW